MIRIAFYLTFVAAVLHPPAVHAALEAQPLELPGMAEPSVVANGERGFVLTWIDRGPDGVTHLRFAALDRVGAVLREGEIASGKDWFVNWADFPSLAIADNGDWVTFFLRRIDPAKPYAYEVRTTRSTDAGRSWSEPVLLHDDGTPTEHGFVSLLPDGGERVLAVWLDGRRTSETGDPHVAGGHAVTTLRTAVLAREGPPRDARELDALTCDCCSTDAARDGAGHAVVYRDRTAEEVRDVHWLVRGSNGWTAPRPVHADGWKIAGCPVNGPALAAVAGGHVVAWPTMTGDAYHVRVARRDGNAWSAPVKLEAGAGVLGRVDAAAWSDGGALVSWLGAGDDATVLRVARLDRTLTERGRIDVASLPPGRMTGMPRLAASGDVAVLVWTSPEVRGGKVRGALLRDAGAAAPAPGWLDPGELAAIRDARGHGMAAAAEAHALPGPRHALDLADELGLDDDQRSTLDRLMTEMRAGALSAGDEVLRAERALDVELAASRPDPERVETLSVAAGEARGRLRAVHLKIHIAAGHVLTPAQRARYVALRNPPT